MPTPEETGMSKTLDFFTWVQLQRTRKSQCELFNCLQYITVLARTKQPSLGLSVPSDALCGVGQASHTCSCRARLHPAVGSQPVTYGEQSGEGVAVSMCEVPGIKFIALSLRVAQ